MANYPRQIKLDPDTEDRLRSYLNIELLNHYEERQPAQEDIKRYQTDYWARPRTEKLKFPFDGAASLIIPLTAITVEAIHARNMTTLFALDQFVAAKVVNPKWADAAHPVESALDHAMLNDMKIKKKFDSILLETEKFGTGVGKVGYERLKRKAVRENPDGSESEFDVIVKDGPCCDAVSLGRYLMPYSYQDPQMAEWVGEEQTGTPFEVKTMEESGMFKKGTFDILKDWVVRSAVGTLGVERQFQRRQEELEKHVAQWPKYLDWVEIWMAWDVDGDGKKEEIVVHYHRASNSFMSIRYNWYADLHRPYRIVQYFPVEHRWAGIGICKQNEQFQKEITTQHRQRIDNATLANMRMIKVSRLSGYGAGEPVFPGKMWILDDMTHIDTFQMGEIYPSSFNDEQATLQYSQQRTGVNDAILGAPQVGTPGTATSDLARIQEGNKKFDYIYGGIKDFANEIILDTACVWQQYGPRQFAYYENAEDGDIVEKFFKMPPDLIRGNLLLQLRGSGQQQNKILDRQNWTQVGQLLNQYFDGMIQLAQAGQQQQLIQVIASRGLTAATEVMKQILESFDVKNIDRIIVQQFVKDLKANVTSISAGSDQGAPQQGAQPALPALGSPGSPSAYAAGSTPGVADFANLDALASARSGQPANIPAAA